MGFCIKKLKKGICLFLYIHILLHLDQDLDIARYNTLMILT
nr:MAG TPA: hypothetical protein [Caudoviricetes sp.]